MFKGRATTLTRFTTLILTTAVIAGCGGGDAATETTIVEVDTRTPAPDWELVWSDEFDGGSLDLDKWTFEINCDGGGNAEEQCYTDSPENLFIEDGILNIVARPTPADSSLTKPYTSSRIVTQYQGDWTYGRVEVRAKAPKGQGSWAAAWLMPTNSEYGTWPLSGEIDLVEWVNIGEVRADGDIDRHAHGTLHYGPMQGSNHDFTGTEYALPNSSPADDFHIYAIEWEEGEIRWYVDDVLYAYQRDSEVTYRASDGAAAGLSETGWYTQIMNDDGIEEIVYQKAPYDQDFFIILNNAVGGNWAGRTHQSANYFVGDDNGSIARGVDNSAYVNGNAYQVDYVRVYQCAKDTVTGKGCATISSDYYNDTFVKGAAPVPIPPIIPVPVGVDIFTEDQSSWDVVGEDEAETVDSGDEEYGEVVQFTVTEESGELGFSGPSYDGTLLPDEALIEFDIKVLETPTNSEASWVFKVEYETAPEEEASESPRKYGLQRSSSNSEAETGEVELALNDSLEGVLPTPGEWQHYSFDFGALRELGLDSENIVAIKVFPTLGQGAGAVYQVDNVTIGAAFEGAELLLFEDEENPNWPMWDDQVAQGLSSIVPVVVQDEDPDFGNAAEFYINGNSVVGFTVRQDQGGSGYPFDASSLALSGAIEFDLKLIDFPENPNAPWYLKMESNGGTNLGGTAVDYRLPTAPVQDEWTHYTVSMNSLLQEGLDISAIDIALIFPQWGQGDGARFRVDNMIIHSTTVDDSDDDDVVKGPDNTVYQELFTLYDDAVRSGWTLWDCCAFLPQVEVMDDEDHNMVVEFTIGEGSDGGTVVGFWGRSSGETLNLAPITTNGVLRFDLKVVTMPEDETTDWLIKVESSNATGNSFAELSLTDSLQGVAPTLGEWQSYSFPLIDLAGAGLNLTEVDLLMMFPQWGKGLGAVYRVDNVFVGIPEGDENPYGDDMGSGGDNGGDNGGDDGSGDDGSGGDNGTQEPGVELIQNSDFGNSAGWGGTDGMVESIANGIFTADVAVAGNPWDVSLKQNMLLLNDSTYTLSFDARSDDARSIIAGLGLDEAPWTNVAETVQLSTEWTTYTFTLTTTGFGSSNSRVFFDMGAEAGQVQLDNVSVVLVTDGSGSGDDNSGDDNSGDNNGNGELLTNSSFDSSEGWGGTDGMVESIVDGMFTANVAVAGNPWDVSLKQNLTLVADTDYVLSFDARSDDARSIIAGLGLDQEPWTNVTETVALTTEWVTYTLNLTTTGFGGENNRVFFDMGAEAGQVQLDNVSLTLASSGGDDDSSGPVITMAPASIFADAVLDNWASWDCCAGSTPIVVEDDAMYGNVVEFMVNGDTVLGFNGRDNGGALDASGVTTFSFDMKVTSLPTQADAPWLLKMESGDAASYVEVNLSASQEGVVPTEGQWQTYTFALADLVTAGVSFDTSNIDVVMVFPAWGQGAGAVYRIDNVSFSGESDGAGDAGGDDSGNLDTSAYCEATVYHFGNSDIANSAALLTIESLDANTMQVTVGSPTDDLIDVLVISGPHGGTPGAQDTSVAGTISQTLTWDTAPAEVSLNVLWSHESFEGNWQLSDTDITVPFAAMCGDTGGDNTGGDSGDNGGDESPALLANSGFDSAEGWGGTDGMVESIVDGIFTANVAIAGNPWDVSLKQNLTLVADTDYVLTFDARSDDARSIIAGLGLDQDPWTNVTETVALTTEWATYTLNLTTTGFGGENNRVFFDMGAEAGQVQLDNVILVLASDYTGEDMADDNAGPVVTMAPASIFADSVLDNWASWDCCAGSTPTVVEDDAMYGNVVEFMVNGDTVLGFNGRENGGAIDASGVSTFSFDMKVTSLPTQADAPWLLKIESGDAANFVEVNLSTSQEGVVPAEGQWQTYTFALADLVAAGVNLDTSNIDVVMVFPAWGQGAGAVYRIDNVSFSGEASADDGPVVTMAPASLFIDTVLDNWASWDCCAGSTPTIVDDGGDNGSVIEFTVNGDTVLGLNGRDNGGALDASNAATLSFDMKVTTMPTQADAPWLLKIESGNGGSYVEVNLSTSQEGVVPAEGQWQTYTFSMDDLVAAGVNFDRSNIDIVMVFPAWGQGSGAVYRVDNVSFQ
ncbi:hypothetical protein tloyanaT_19030 [Thalassotalea loyana]|uniref:GH16 domain-containing protein n=1 Tax=Thalassotalea loyana TaxID=280483 RepID=A0ABQ6HFI7_9GAMM|nr:carbohydrate binding domain-containing protein [Thalassotalea loyana]GLX85651.1 hypothetical protein tloyanaT_19030 [Thalassotalea loyana]